MTFCERVYWNTQSYGSAVTVKRAFLIGLLVVLCLATPCTNWLIPFSNKIIKRDLVWRYD